MSSTTDTGHLEGDKEQERLLGWDEGALISRDLLKSPELPKFDIAEDEKRIFKV